MDATKQIDRMIDRIALRSPLDAEDRAAIHALPFEARVVEAGRYLIREGSTPEVSTLLTSGFAYRHKLTADGDRQIVSIHVPGDFIDLQASLLKVADHNVQVLVGSEIATVPIRAVLDLIAARPAVGQALWIDTLVEASTYREWVLNVGRRNALQRVGHLLCEFARRLEVAGLGTTDGYLFPMTQEQLADATGLTPVHVNRTLKQLSADGLIRRHNRFIEIPDWDRLRDMSGFTDLYLHLD